MNGGILMGARATNNSDAEANPFIRKHHARLMATLALLDDMDALNCLAVALADRLIPVLAERLSSSDRSPWIRGANEAARYLGCPPSRIYDLVSRGDLQHEHDGSRLVFKREWLDLSVSNGAG